MEKIEKGIYPVDDGSHYGDVLYGYTDVEEAKRDYKDLTGEELDVDNIQHLNIEQIGEGFSWANPDKGVRSILNLY